MPKLISRFDAIRFPLIPKRLYLGRQARRASNKVEKELKLLEYLVPKNTNAIDGGANKGIYSYYLSMLCQQVHAFEPNPTMYAYLKAAVPNNVITYQIALSDVIGQASFNVPTTANTFHHTRGSLLEVQGEKGETGVVCIDVEVVTLDSLQLDNIGFIKLDLEGNELAALMGAQQLIEKNRPVILAEATNTGKSSASDLVDYLCEQEYTPLLFKDNQLMDYGKNTAANITHNCIFLPRQG
jgi:FkbM family methyltransferase